MPLQLPPGSFKNLEQLVMEYNKVKEEDHPQRLFYLQKINYELNKAELNHELFEWMSQSTDTSWQNHLLAYSINPNASFLLKGIQFAQAVDLKLNPAPEKTQTVALDKIINDQTIYILLQKRDALLKNNAFETCRSEYIEICSQLNDIAKNNNKIIELIKRQTQILEHVHVKLEAIKGNSSPKDQDKKPVTYKTKELGDQVNNFNFKLEMGAWTDPFVFRVEDRPDLGLEQELNSFPVAKYFIEDFAMFRMEFKEKNSSVEYKPVVLSEFAKQGNLIHVARTLSTIHKASIAPRIGYFFEELTDFCVKLMDTNTFHPDIKLSNFLLHKNRVLVSDRKTFINEENPLASEVRSSPLYAPEEYIDCLNINFTAYNYRATKTKLNMPQFMAFQLGMALKEFMILTQLEELPEDFRNPDHNAASYFQSPSTPIINLSFLVQELTRPDPKKRMTIKQFQSLLIYRNFKPDNFYKEVERVLPSSAIGIQDEIKEITDVLEGNLKGEELLAKANLIFSKISTSEPKETRLTRLAEKLATKVFKEYSENYFAQCSKSIEEILLNQDWEKAPWYRKVFHWLSFGFFRVDRTPNVDMAAIKIKQDIKGREFQANFQLLEFLPPKELNSFGVIEGTNFKEFIYAHLEEILNPETSNKDSSKGTSKESTDDENTPLLVPKDTLPSDTLLITEKDEDEALPSGTVVITETEKDNKSLPSGTVVITDTDKVSNPKKAKFLDQVDITPPKKEKTPQLKKGEVPEALAKLSIFATPKDDADAKLKNHKPKLLARAISVRGALLRGDYYGSNRDKAKEARPSINNMNWDAPIP